jgi:hypothetical protein
MANPAGAVRRSTRSSPHLPILVLLVGLASCRLQQRLLVNDSLKQALQQRRRGYLQGARGAVGE